MGINRMQFLLEALTDLDARYSGACTPIQALKQGQPVMQQNELKHLHGREGKVTLSDVGSKHLQMLFRTNRPVLRGMARSLQARGSKLILLRGPPQQQLPLFWREHHVTDLVFESDTGALISHMHSLAHSHPTPTVGSRPALAPQFADCVRASACVSAEPYARQRDAAIVALAEADNVKVTTAVGHTLYVSAPSSACTACLYDAVLGAELMLQR